MLKRILICSNFYPPFFVGGAEIIAHEQALYLKKNGYEVFVFCGKHDDSHHHYSLIKENYNGLRVFRVILHAQNYYIGENFYNPTIDNLFDTVLEEVRPDVIHFHNIVGLSLGIIDQARKRGIRTLLTLHDHWGFCYKNTLLKEPTKVCNDFSKCGECLPELTDSQGRRLHIRMRQDYIALQFAKIDRLVSPSSYLASAYVKAGIPANQISVISYGVNVERFSRILKVPAKRPIRFTFIGYLGLHKGVHVLLNAIDLLRKGGYLGNLCIVNIVGVGAMADEVAKFVKENRLDGVVKLWGKVNHTQIEKVYQSTDVLVTPSIWPENEPVTILEAMAAGIPVLASALGGNIELVKQGITGCLFESGNAQILAEKMVEMAQNRNHLEVMGRNAYQQIVEDTLNNYVQQIVKVYQDQEKISTKFSDRIILCSGDSLSMECAFVIDQFCQQEGNKRYRFVMSDWIKPEDWENVELVWVVDDNGKERDLIEGMKRGRSLLVPQRNQKLVELCRRGQCGLFYADEIEAEVCLQYLIDRPSVLAALGRNAKSASENGMNTLSIAVGGLVSS